jgi:tetratricopeptide (TPR) repeat protein
MKLMQRFGLLLILVAVVLVADRLIGPSSPLVGLGDPNAAGPQSNVDPSLPAQPYNDTLIGQLEARLQKDPNDWHAYQQLGYGYIQKARDTGDPAYYGRAESALEKAVQINAEDADSIVGLGSLALSRHEFQQALDWGLKAYALAPHNARVYGVLGDAYTELGNYEGAVQAVQTMVDTRPDLSSYSRVSYVRELHGDMPGAIDAMQQAVEAGSPNAENTNWTRVQLGQLYWMQGNLAAAEREYQQVLTYFPTYMYALGSMGQVRAAQGKLDEAADYYRRALDVVPLPQYVIALGDIYTRQGKADEAKKQYDLLQFIAKTYEANGVNFDIELASFLADHDQDLPRALALAQKSGASRQDVHTQDAFAWVLYKNGKYDEAQAAMTKALRLGKLDPLFYFHAGMIAARRGDTAQARTYLQKALALNPQFHIFYADQAAAELRKLGQER